MVREHEKKWKNPQIRLYCNLYLVNFICGKRLSMSEHTNKIYYVIKEGSR